MATNSAPSSRGILGAMPQVHDGIGFRNGLLQGTATFGKGARESSVGPNADLIARLGPEWEREGRVSVNPTTLDCGRYLAGCLMAERDQADPSSGFGLGVVDRPEWGSPIAIDAHEGGAVLEGTKATLVAFTPQKEPTGHVCLNFSLWADPNDRRVRLYTDVLIVYVLPQYRGKGYSIDLSVVGGWVMSGIVKAAMAAVPNGGSFRFTGIAKYLSKGGERVCRAVWAAAEATQLSCRDPRRPDLVIEPASISVEY